MAPNIQARQLLVWTSIPTIAIILYTSFLWYKRKRSVKEADPGERQIPQTIEEPPVVKRSLSGVESQPIDIVLPESIRVTKGPGIVISDKDLDLQIAKIKSMKSPYAKTETSPPRVRSALTMELEKTKMEVAPATSTTPKNKKANRKKKSIPESKEINLSHGESRQSSDRDSANNSPADVMLSSPSLSIISDNQSEGSNDSGKGGSDVATPARDGSLSGDLNPEEQVTFYEFEIPQLLVGRLIGRRGCFAQDIRAKTKATILVKDHPDNDDLKLCAIEGTPKEIKDALAMIRKKFPKKQYSNLTLEQVHITIPKTPVIPRYNYLKLVECINNDTIISHVETPVHLFLHFHTHPTFRGLQRLVESMKHTYSQNDPQQLFPTTPSVSQMCVAQLEDTWYRAQIIATNPEDDTSDVQFLDFGGYCNVKNSSLRQIHFGYISLPFQAAECYLANVRLKPDVNILEGVDYVDRVTKNCLLQTSIVEYTSENIPRVYVYFINAHNEIFCLNDEVVLAGYAEYEELPTEQQV